MKAIFLCENTNKIFKVFVDETISELNKLTGIEKRIYSKEEILSDPNAFWDVEFIFSTWAIPRLTEEEIEKCFPSLKCLFYGAGTVQAFAEPFFKRGVRIFSSWVANGIPVAEMAAAEIVLANTGYFVTSRIFHKEGKQPAILSFAKCNGNYGETVGIIGAGTIGKHVISLLKQYRLNILVFDPFLSDEKASELGVKKCGLEELFEKSFAISNHLADKNETKNILNYALFSKMRENAVFINTGRGAQVVEDDLVRILEERPDLTALLDVTWPEPPVDGHPFYTLPNCVLTPHIAGCATLEFGRMGEFMLEECRSYLNGEPTKYEITEEMLKTMA